MHVGERMHACTCTCTCMGERMLQGLYRICSAFGRAMPQMANLLVLVLLIVTIFALLGMQMEGGRNAACDSNTRLKL